MTVPRMPHICSHLGHLRQVKLGERERFSVGAHTLFPVASCIPLEGIGAAEIAQSPERVGTVLGTPVQELVGKQASLLVPEPRAWRSAL